MLFLICLFLFNIATAELLGDNHLQFNHNIEYASNYDNYKPHDYQFNYGVSDPHTGDHKSQWEVKENGVVRGGYSLLEPDGTTRIVEYIADDDGFRAVVKKIGTAIHPTPLEQPLAIHNEIVPQIKFNTYDGHVENYIHTLPTSLSENPITYYDDGDNDDDDDDNDDDDPAIDNHHYYAGNIGDIQHIQYHGINNNPEDDSKYTSDHYHGNLEASSHVNPSALSHYSVPLPYHLVIHY